MKKWFYGKVKKEGYYGCKRKEGKPFIVYHDGGDDLPLSTIGNDTPLDDEDFKGCQWYGPIELGEQIAIKEITAKEIETLKIDPGDIIKIRLREYITTAESHYFREYLQGLFPDNEVIVLMPDCDMEIEKGNREA